MSDSNPKIPKDRPTVERDPLQLVSGIVGVIGFVFTLASNIYIVARLTSNADPTLASIGDALKLNAALSVLLFASLWIVCFFYSKRARTVRDKTVALELLKAEKSKLEQNSSLICNTFQSIAKEQYEYCSSLYRGNAGSAAETMATFKSHLESTLSRTAEIFSLFTAHPSAACIKIFKDGSDQRELPGAESLGQRPMQFVSTLRRDLKSKTNRKSVDSSPACRSYRYHLNTAFKEIVDDTRKPDHFVCDDLYALGEDYQNENKAWPSFYNAALVVPIKPPGSPAHEVCMGFLCVDNMKGGFEIEEAIYMMEEIAVMIYLSLEMTITYLQEDVK